ncbi:hypothetical protein Aab01nite_65480 [Paractinoplanes abujensis]|nr:hypothetical protein Aab01nite_65480 [Actinoplanes abujensis]
MTDAVPSMHDQTVRNERLSFFIESVQTVPDGWRLEGEPGCHPAHWARPGDRFDRACRDDGRNERDVDLVVLELTESYVVVNGSGGDQLRPDDIVSGERLIDDAGQAAERPLRPEQAARGLARILGLSAVIPKVEPDWTATTKPSSIHTVPAWSTTTSPCALPAPPKTGRS